LLNLAYEYFYQINEIPSIAYLNLEPPADLRTLICLLNFWS